VDENRSGDHICYISNLGKLRNDYPNWTVSRSPESIIEEVCRVGQRSS